MILKIDGLALEGNSTLVIHVSRGNDKDKLKLVHTDLGNYMYICDDLAENYEVIPDENGRFYFPMTLLKLHGALAGYHFLAIDSGIVVQHSLFSRHHTFSNLYHGYDEVTNQSLYLLGDYSLLIKSLYEGNNFIVFSAEVYHEGRLILSV